MVWQALQYTWLHTALGLVLFGAFLICVDLWNPSWRDGGWLQFLHGYAVRYVIADFAMVEIQHIERGYERMIPMLWAIWMSHGFLHVLFNDLHVFWLRWFSSSFVAMRRIRLWICFCNFGLFLLELMTLRFQQFLDVFTSTVVFVWFWSWWNRCLKRQVEFVENMSMRMPKFRFHGEKSRL